MQYLRGNPLLSLSAQTSACWRRKCLPKRGKHHATYHHQLSLRLFFFFSPFFLLFPRNIILLWDHTVNTPWASSAEKKLTEHCFGGGDLGRAEEGCGKAEKGGTEKGWEPCRRAHWQKKAGTGYVSAFGWLWEEQVLGLKCLDETVPFLFRRRQWVSWSGFSARRSQRGSRGDRNEGEQEILLSTCWGEGDPHYQHPSYWGYRIWPAWEYSE